MKELDLSKSQTIAALRGRRVLVTGATGFLGKVVMEKLIRTVPDVGGIYLLMRGNRHYKDARSRFLHEIATSSVFDALREERGKWFEEFCEHRVHCVTGEVTAPRFGLSLSAFNTLASDVDAIINSAASVNFREELDKALEINTLSLNNIAELAEASGNVPLIQVSTCYVNGFNQGGIKEQVLAPQGKELPRHEQGYFEIYSCVAALQEKIEHIRGQFEGRALKGALIDLGIEEAQAAGWNDTYTYTKWLGEQLLLKRLRGYPMTIVRPSIIESTLREPKPGWIEGVKVADAILLAYARGKVSFFPGKRSGVIDLIPADLVANSILLALAEQFIDPGKHRIYQCCSGGRNPLTMGNFIDHITAEAKENYQHYDKLFQKPPQRDFKAVDKRLFTLVISTVRLALALFNQCLSKLGLRKKVRAKKNIDAAIELSAIFSFYAVPKYRFHNDRLLSLSKAMGAVDQVLFPVDSGAIDWQDYIRNVHIAGLNHYALNGQAHSTRSTSSAIEAAAKAITEKQPQRVPAKGERA
ncbi:MAG: fatty acyl-CoA reductase [Spongiibacter sp.]|nr:fatty acyl-CoA reductase [Spongiibacter sp.]